MNSNPKKGFFAKMRLPHAFTLLFAILLLVGFLSLVLSWTKVTVANNDGLTYSETWGQIPADDPKFKTIQKVSDGMGKDSNDLFDHSATRGFANDTPDKLAVVGGGIIDWFTAVPAGFIDAASLIVFLLVLGGFINLVLKTRALDAFIAWVVGFLPKKDELTSSKMSGMSGNLKTKDQEGIFCTIKECIRHTWVIIPLMLFFSFGGSTYGMAEESLAFYAIIIPFAVAAGFDVFTGFLIIFLGAGVGVMTSTINPFSVISAQDAAKSAFIDSTSQKTIDDDTVLLTAGAPWRWITWVVLTITAIVSVMIYALKVKKDKSKAKLADMFEVHKKIFAISNTKSKQNFGAREKITVTIFILTFVVMVAGMINWDKAFDVIVFENIEKKFFGGQSTTSWFHNTNVSQGASWQFGNWWLLAISVYFFMISLIIAIINWKSEEHYIESMVEGAKDMIGVIFAIGIARGISVYLASTNLQALFASGLVKALEGAGAGQTYGKITVPVISYIFFIPLCFFIPSTSGLAGATFPTIGEALAKKDIAGGKELFSGVVTGYSMGAGYANMFVPTYGVVIGALALTKISFGKFISVFWKFLALFFVLGLTMIIAGGVLNLTGANLF